LPPVSLVLLIPVANLPPVSTIPVANFATIFTSDVDTVDKGGKFATCVSDTIPVAKFFFANSVASDVDTVDGVNDTGSKFAAGNYTGSKFATGVNDTGGK
jgi:hypothetical protein